MHKDLKMDFGTYEQELESLYIDLEQTCSLRDSYENEVIYLESYLLITNGSADEIIKELEEHKDRFVQLEEEIMTINQKITKLKEEIKNG